MSRAFEVLDCRSTPMGELMLRRRLEPSLQIDVWEVKLGDEFLMSSQFTATEEAVATLALGQLDGDGFDVLVGGLGLGHTAVAALGDTRVGSMVVVELFDEVIEWHHEGLVPLGPLIIDDPRCRVASGDFFAVIAEGGAGIDERRRFDAILVDIDHSPHRLLSNEHAGFYRPDALGRVRGLLRPGGVFSLWSDDPPDDGFVATLETVFPTVTANVVSFANHYTGGESACTVYTAR